MIPILYKSTETNFGHNGLGYLKDTISCLVTEKRNGMYELELEYPLGSFLCSEIRKLRIIKAKANDRYDDQLFRIYNTSKPLNGIITVKAQHISYDNKNNLVENLNFDGNCIGALEMLKGSGDHECRFNFISDITMSANFKVERKSILSAIAGSSGSIINTYGNGADIVRDNFNISILADAGLNKKVLIAYKKNLTGFKCEENVEGLVTRIYPYAIKNDVTITLPEKYINSQYINNYHEPYTLEVDYSNNESVVDEATLRAKAITYFSNTDNDIPKLNYDIEFVSLSKTINYKNMKLTEDIGLFDTVIVRHEIYGIDSEVKIIEVQYDTLKEKYIKIISGQPKTSLDGTLNDIKEEVNKDKVTPGFLDKAISDLTNAITGNDGGYVRLNPPENPSEILILDNEDINLAQIVWRWNKEGWGVSRTGYNGPFYGMTKNGKLVIDEVTAYKMSALLVQTGVLKSINNLSWISLDDGTFNLGNKITFDGTNFNIDLSDKGLATDEDLSNGLSFKVGKGDEFKTEFNQNASEFNFTIGSDGLNIKMDKNGETIRNGALTVINSNGQVTIDGGKLMLRILAYGNGALTIPDGSQNASIIIPHGLGYSPIFQGQFRYLKSDGTVETYSDSLNLFDWGTGVMTYNGRMFVDDNNLNIHISRTSAYANSGSQTIYYRYFIMEGVNL